MLCHATLPHLTARSGIVEEANTILLTTLGVMDSSTSKLSVTYGPQIPLDPPIVFDQVSQLHNALAAVASSSPCSMHACVRPGACAPHNAPPQPRTAATRNTHPLPNAAGECRVQLQPAVPTDEPSRRLLPKRKRCLQPLLLVLRAQARVRRLRAGQHLYVLPYPLECVQPLLQQVVDTISLLLYLR